MERKCVAFPLELLSISSSAVAPATMRQPWPEESRGTGNAVLIPSARSAITSAEFSRSLRQVDGHSQGVLARLGSGDGVTWPLPRVSRPSCRGPLSGVCAPRTTSCRRPTALLPLPTRRGSLPKALRIGSNPGPALREDLREALGWQETWHRRDAREPATTSHRLECGPARFLVGAACSQTCRTTLAFP